MNPQSIFSLLKQSIDGRDPSERVLVGFDFDGTLVPISEKPEGIHVDPRIAGYLRESARRLPLLIATGRGLEGLRTHIPDIPGLDLIGNHGADLAFWQKDERGARVLQYRSYAPEGWEEFHRTLLLKLHEKVASQGGVIEDKGHSITLHYRLSGTAYWTGSEGEAWLAALAGIKARLIPGKMCWNLVPPGISKGVGVARYCREKGYRRMIFFGDEPTDESVFELGALGEIEVLGVKVGDHPAQTSAKYALESVRDVIAWLGELAALT